MANEEHFTILKQGAKAFNRWRRRNPDIRPDFRGAHLRVLDLSGVDLSGVKLSGAYLYGVNLRGADLSRTDLSGTDLSGMDLSGMDLSEANLSRTNLSKVSFIDANLNNAILTDSRLWETQRTGWSIKGVKCESAFFDREGNQAIQFALGEFEKLYSEKIKILLPYEGGINSIELLTLPALIKLMENEYEGCSLRFHSVQDDAGGATVTLVVDDLGQHDLASLRASAEEAQQLQLKLREEETTRLMLQGQIDLMMEKVFPAMLEHAMNKSNITINGPVNAAQIGHNTLSDSATQTFNQNFYNQNDLASIKELIGQIQTQRQELAKQLPSEKIGELDGNLHSIEQQLDSDAPDHSTVRNALRSVKTILEGASGAVVASGWLELIQRFL